MVNIIMHDAFSYFFIRRIRGASPSVAPKVIGLLAIDPNTLEVLDPYQIMEVEAKTDGT